MIVSLKCIQSYILDFIISLVSVKCVSVFLKFLATLNFKFHLEYRCHFLHLNCFKIKRKYIKLCKNHVSIHCHNIGLQNSCHIQDIYHVRDNVSLSSILQIHNSKFLLYLKSTACQYLLFNEKSVLKEHSYKT